MLGKTNIIYVAKDQGSEMQFVTETFITQSSSDIEKIKYLNGLFFVFVAGGSVLYGEDINDLNFLRDNEKLISASNVVYFKGKYVFIDTNLAYRAKNASYYVTEDLSVFNLYEIPQSAISKGSLRILDMAINYTGQLAFLVYVIDDNSSISYTYFRIWTCDVPTDADSFEIQHGSKQFQGNYVIKKNTFMRDRFLVYCYFSSTEYCYCITMDGTMEEVAVGNYPIGIVDNMAYISIDTNTYYSLNFKNYIKVRSFPLTCCFPIGGRIGLYNEGTLELASKVTDFASEKSTTLEISGIDYEVLCYTVVDEYTYLGCKGGIVIQCLLDVEGIYQTPEIALVKTLSAKQALSQAMNYTDEKIAELKSYVDNRLN